MLLKNIQVCSQLHTVTVLQLKNGKCCFKCFDKEVKDG